MPDVSHGLGFGNGSIIENTENGTVQFRATGTILPAFNVRLADVTGVSSQRKGFLKVVMRVHGQGTVLAEVDVNHGTTELVSAWFASRIGLGATRVSQNESVSKGQNPSISVELTKLAALHKNGVLSDDEFSAAKRKLVGLE